MPVPLGETQICRDCGEEKANSCFSRNGRKDGYRRPECRSCQHDRSKEINLNYQMTPGAVAVRARHTLNRKDVLHWKAIKLAEQQGICVYCGHQISNGDSHLDHSTPLARGGTNDPDNLQVLCERCNGEKHAKSDAEYRLWLQNKKS